MQFKGQGQKIKQFFSDVAYTLQQYASFLASATFLENKLLLDFIPGRNTIHRVNAVVLVRLPLGKNLAQVERHAFLDHPPPSFLGDNAVVATSFFGLLGIEYINKKKAEKCWYFKIRLAYFSKSLISATPVSTEIMTQHSSNSGKN